MNAGVTTTTSRTATGWGTLRESIRLGNDDGYKTCALMLARELARRKVDPLPFLAAAKMLDVPVVNQGRGCWYVVRRCAAGVSGA